MKPYKGVKEYLLGCLSSSDVIFKWSAHSPFIEECSNNHFV
jgi:hypothetical protein